MYKPTARRLGGAIVVASSLVAFHASAQIAVSSNDHKMVQENGVTRTSPNASPDTATILDLGASPVKVVATVNDVPGSVAGPPLNVAITPDETLALVASSTRLDPADRSKTLPDDRITVIDLKTNKVIGRLTAGAGAAGLSISPDGKRAYVANRSAGSISILAIDGQKVSLVKTVPLVGAADLISHVALSPDGVTALATVNATGKVELLKLSGDEIWRVSTLATPAKPYPAVFDPTGRFAFVGCGGDANGHGMIAVIDLADPAGKVVASVDIGFESLEGMMMSGDGKWLAAVAHAGSTRPKDAPQYKPAGQVVLFAVTGPKLIRTSSAPIGAWSQGAAFARNNATLVVQNMVQQNLMVFRNDNGQLTDTGQTIALGGGAAGIRASYGR
ncbi:MAG TPA: cytochrome D1 domain-containing protein [Reyranella sp.]|nr:cytochrome D1 domain-containing protein [Reyranella sp.]